MKYIVFTDDYGNVIVCNPEEERECLKHFFLNGSNCGDNTAPDGFERKEILGPFILIQPRLEKSKVFNYE